MLNLDPSTLIARVIVLIVAFTIHEFSHALTADYFGDETPRLNGRLTLNPLAHLDPLGSLLLLVAGFGWAKPVPINPYALNRRSSAAVALVSFAGPLSNLIMALLAAIPFRLGLVDLSSAFIASGTSHLLPTLPQLLLTFIEINLILMLFNLIPLAPLDGEKIAEYFFPPSWSRALDQIRPYGPMILLAVIFVGPLVHLDIIGWVIGVPMSYLLRLLVG
ncbi:MAG TPA: site-2 protease family protein [Anaerolineales bacterium]